MKALLRRLTPLGVFALIATPAIAQDADWDLTEGPDGRAVVASVMFDSGVGVATRCVGGRYEVAIGSLPAVRRTALARPLAVALGDEPLDETDWNVTDDPTMATAQLSAPLARKLRAGGRLRIQAPAGPGGARALRYDLDLPPSHGAIDRTLTACGQSVTG